MPDLEQRSVSLFSSYKPDALARLLSVSSGVRPATTEYSNPYRLNAFVPAKPWRAIEECEIATYFALSSRWKQSRSVAILGPTSKLLSFLDTEGLGRRPLHELTTEVVDGIAEKIFMLMQEICEFSGDTMLIGLARNAPNMPTVSINRNLGKLVGLHIDYWDGLPLSERDRSLNRISLNVGPSSRQILFVPLVLEDMARELEKRTGSSADLPELPTLYMKTFASEVPVIGCKLCRGAAYIMPTENILHDGSTFGQRDESRQIVFRGNIAPIMVA